MRKIVDMVLIVTGLAFIFFLVPHAILTIDGVDRYRAVILFLTERGFSPTPYSIVGPLFSIPLSLVSHWGLSFEWWCARYNAVVFALGVLSFYFLLRPHLEPAIVRRFLLILVAGSMFANHTRHYHGEVFTAILVGAGFMLVFLRNSAWGWPLTVLAAANTPASILGYGFVVLQRIWDRKRLRYLLALIAAAALVLLENWLKRGHPLRSGYEGNHGARTLLPYSGLPDFSYPFVFGILSQLFSFGKGLVFFAPGILLAFSLGRHLKKPELLKCHHALLWFLAGLILVYAKWWAWYGGFSWGPRFLLVASIPASLALAVIMSRAESLGERSIALGLLTLSIWVGISGAVFDLDRLGICDQDNYAHECFMWYVPEFSVLWRPFVDRRLLQPGDMALLTYGCAVLVYLGAPLLGSIGRDLAQRATATCRDAKATWRNWRV